MIIGLTESCHSQQFLQRHAVQGDTAMGWFQSNPGPAPASHRARPFPPFYRERMERIRAALIEALPPGAHHLAHCIEYAGDPVLLWNLRPEVMSVLSRRHGEAHARQVMARISPLFQEVLPDGLATTLRAAGSAPAQFEIQKETA
jgi:hypothetical protein